ncbi:hypothetical protein Poly41_66890 [Novipirellula artificiosorum]|uniref:Uncharacterized protein n=1 Tax=Novipirellula artificiosorum TaxID=2528016 RepID=A0A5C6D039_9BACT|nr:hypothetical protein Poly41_66890 [Novipirellula artificiosorum]
MPWYADFNLDLPQGHPWKDITASLIEFGRARLSRLGFPDFLRSRWGNMDRAILIPEHTTMLYPWNGSPFASRPA